MLFHAQHRGTLVAAAAKYHAVDSSSGDTTASPGPHRGGGFMTFDMGVVLNAQRVATAAQREVLAAVGAERAVVVKAVAGAGKTGFIVDTVGAARDQNQRVVVCAPTNGQAFE